MLGNAPSPPVPGRCGAAVSVSSLQHRLSPSGVTPAPGTALPQHGLGRAVAAAPRGHMASTGTVPALLLSPRGRRWRPGRSPRSSQALLLPPGRGEWTRDKRGTRASWKLLKAAGAGSKGGPQRGEVRAGVQDGGAAGAGPGHLAGAGLGLRGGSRQQPDLPGGTGMDHQWLEPHGGGGRAGDGGGPAEGQLTVLPEAGPQPEQEDPDVWQVLRGDKDDFLVYDRCGRLAFHIQLPFSFLHFPYVEAAIRSSHIKDFCGNCSLYPNTTQEANSTTAGHATPSSPPEHEGMESETPIHQHKPLHPHHHDEVSSKRDTNPTEDHKPATHAHHHHGDHGQLHHKGKKQKEGDEH
uniref:Selenoprotein P N-terminal domain-containing protein n=1 Tax=Corvus moneduloides TaxID=1196302 RepID=A0A8C3EHR6_CORMO